MRPLIHLLNSVLGWLGLKLVRQSALEEMSSLAVEGESASRRHARLVERLGGNPSSSPRMHPTLTATSYRAEDVLVPTNPRLVELQLAVSRATSPASEPSRWSDRYVDREVDLQRFRSDNAYLWQHRDLNYDVHYVLTHAHLLAADTMGLFEMLHEDEAFGCHTVAGCNGQLISRDLLDSVSEILFLERTLAVSSIADLGVADIGAGYGRLAHRLVTALPNVRRYLCLDAVAHSTFLAEFYLAYRGVDQRARAVPLDQAETALGSGPVQLAVNIHSFSECTLAATEWWLDLLVRHNIEFLLVVPNAEDHEGQRLLSTEVDDERLDFASAITSRGFELLVDEPKYQDPAVQRHGVSPTRRYLYHRQVAA